MADRPLLVFAERQDVSAAAFVVRHHEIGARLVSAPDLSRVGWRHHVGRREASMAVVDGVVTPVSELRGVITRFTGIGPQQLPHVAQEDRGYVASEMNAFLGAWLCALPCPVLNRPCVPSLSGPAWCRERWTKLALDLDVPVAPLQRVQRPVGLAPAPQSLPHPPTPAVRIDVVGPALLGGAHSQLRVHARRIADAAGVALLGVLFDAPDRNARFIGTDPWPDLSDHTIGNAVIACLP